MWDSWLWRSQLRNRVTRFQAKKKKKKKIEIKFSFTLIVNSNIWFPKIPSSPRSDRLANSERFSGKRVGLITGLGPAAYLGWGCKTVHFGDP